MHDDDINYEVRFAFFKGISTEQHSYLCDFHKLIYKEGKTSYRVVISCLDTSNIIVDINTDDRHRWHITQSTGPLPQDMELKLLNAIAAHEK